MQALPPLDPHRGLAIIDVDEVLALFVQGFDRFLRGEGYELRMTSFALFSNLYPLGGESAADIKVGKGLFDAFFARGCGEIEPAPGAVDGLVALSAVAQVVILTNAPEPARELRGGWLKRHGMDYPLLLNDGLKGDAVARLAGQVSGPVIFVDDLIPNLDSVAEAAPHVVRFQMVADPDLRRMAPSTPRHQRIDHWPDLVAAAHGVFAPAGDQA